MRARIRAAVLEALEATVRDALVIAFSITGAYLAVTMYLLH